MGGFVKFHCKQCRYEVDEIGVGKGKHLLPFLALYRCTKCKTVGSTWIREHEAPRCGVCYEEGVTLLPDNTTHVGCPRCGMQAQFIPQEGVWE